MVGQKRRRSRKPALMGSHQRCWLWGRHLILETLRAGRWPIVELRIDRRLDQDDLRAVSDLAAERSTPVITETAERLTQLCGASDHQGLLAKMRPFPYRTLDNIIAPQPPPTALVMLDRIQDPYNFGAVVRAAEVLGMDGLIVGREGQVNALPIVEVPDLAQAAQQLRGAGFSVLAADASSGVPIARQDLTTPTLLVLGNESTGVSPALIDECDATVKIPQAGRIESLNVAVAAGILCYELRRQREMASPDEGAM